VWGIAESSTSLGGKNRNTTSLSCVKSSEKPICSNIQTPACSVEFWELYQCIPCHSFTSCSWETDGNHCVVETCVDIPILSRATDFMKTVGHVHPLVTAQNHDQHSTESLPVACSVKRTCKKNRDFKPPFIANNVVVNRMRCR